MQSFIGLALMVPEIIKGSLKTPPLDLQTVKKAWPDSVKVHKEYAEVLITNMVPRYEKTKLSGRSNPGIKVTFQKRKKTVLR